MNYKTEMMQEILTNPKAQEIIDYVTPLYGESYVGLWIYQAIGTVLGAAYDLSTELMAETNPEMTTQLLGYWESEYGITPDPELTIEQRRQRIINKIRTVGSCTPARLEAAISAAIGGIGVEITERTAKNQFTVSIIGAASLAPVIEVVERMKPAHLTYVIKGAVSIKAANNQNIAMVLTHAESYKVEVQ